MNSVYNVQCKTFTLAREICNRGLVSTVSETMKPPYCLRILKPYRTLEMQNFRNTVANKIRRIRAMKNQFTFQEDLNIGKDVWALLEISYRYIPEEARTQYYPGELGHIEITNVDNLTSGLERTNQYCANSELLDRMETACWEDWEGHNELN